MKKLKEFLLRRFYDRDFHKRFFLKGIIKRKRYDYISEIYTSESKKIIFYKDKIINNQFAEKYMNTPFSDLTLIKDLKTGYKYVNIDNLGDNWVSALKKQKDNDKIINHILSFEDAIKINPEDSYSHIIQYQDEFCVELVHDTGYNCILKNKSQDLAIETSKGSRGEKYTTYNSLISSITKKWSDKFPVDFYEIYALEEKIATISITGSIISIDDIELLNVILEDYGLIVLKINDFYYCKKISDAKNGRFILRGRVGK